MSRSKSVLSANVVCSDGFADLSYEAQALYVRLVFETDSMGVVTRAKSLARSMGLDESTIKELEGAGYLSRLDVKAGGHAWLVTHHWVNNNIDRANHYKSDFHSDISSQFVFADRNNREYLTAATANEIGIDPVPIDAVIQSGRDG